MFDHCWRQPGSAIDSYVHSCAEGYLVPGSIILTHTSQFMSLLVVTSFEPSSLRIPSQFGSFWWVSGVSWFLSLRSDIVLNELLAVGLCYSYLLACGSFVTACRNNPDRLPKRLLRAEFDFFKRFSQSFRSKGTSSFLNGNKTPTNSLLQQFVKFNYYCEISDKCQWCGLNDNPK